VRRPLPSRAAHASVKRWSVTGARRHGRPFRSPRGLLVSIRNKAPAFLDLPSSFLPVRFVSDGRSAPNNPWGPEMSGQCLLLPGQGSLPAGTLKRLEGNPKPLEEFRHARGRPPLPGPRPTAICCSASWPCKWTSVPTRQSGLTGWETARSSRRSLLLRVPAGAPTARDHRRARPRHAGDRQRLLKAGSWKNRAKADSRRSIV
jgi:hypothetical protein